MDLFRSAGRRSDGPAGDRTLPKPQYDLEAVRSSIDLAKVAEAKWGDGGTTRITATKVAGAPSALAPDAGAALDPAAFRYSRPVQFAPEAGDTTGGLVALPLDAHALAHTVVGRARGSPTCGCWTAPVSRSRTCSSVATSRCPSIWPSSPHRTPQAPELKLPAGSRQRSVYVVTLPYANLPSSTLVLETSARVFQRTVRIGIERQPDRSRREAYFDVRAAETGVTPTSRRRPARSGCASTRCRKHSYSLVVDEGDNAPLPITKARLLLPSYRLRFYHAGNAVLNMAYGRDDLQPPQYDLALLAPRVMGARATEISAAPAGTHPAIACRVIRLPEDLLGRADGSGPRPAGAHREVDSRAGRAGGELTGAGDQGSGGSDRDQE